MAGLDLQPLLDARAGKPSREGAVRVIATFLVIPAAIVGIGLGVFVTPTAATGTRLGLNCAGGAVAVSGVALLFPLLLHRHFGFRPIVWLADALIGGMFGLLIGASLFWLVQWPWVMLACPLGLILTPLLMPAPPREDAPPDQPA
ncbi:MAG: hypothetical protein U0840_17500 [Gemmataceae bacterium]